MIRLALDAKAFKSAMKNAGPELQSAAQKAVVGTALEMQGEVKKRIARGPKSGTTYYRIPGEKYMTVRAGSVNGAPVAFIPGAGAHNLSVMHTASAPGQSPANDTGGLQRRIVFEVVNQLTAKVMATGEDMVPVWLEYGTRKIAPRPFFGPVVDETRPKFQQRMETAILQNVGIFGRAKFRVRKTLGI